MSDVTLQKTLEYILKEARSEIHDNLEVIIHVKTDGIQVSGHVSISGPEDSCWATTMISWKDLMDTSIDAIISKILLHKVGPEIRRKIGQLKYNKAVERGTLEDAAPWSDLPEKMQDIWSEKGFDPNSAPQFSGLK